MLRNETIPMEKGNKQCLLDTSRAVMVNKEDDVRIQRPMKVNQWLLKILKKHTCTKANESYKGK